MILESANSSMLAEGARWSEFYKFASAEQDRIAPHLASQHDTPLDTDYEYRQLSDLIAGADELSKDKERWTRKIVEN